MTKQTSVAEKDSEKEAITPQTILKRFELYNDFVSKIRQQNIEAGLDNKRNNDFVPQTKLLKQQGYEKFIKQTSSPKTGKWNTIHSLQEAGVVSDLDVEQFDSKTFPSVVLHRLSRIKTPDGKEWLQRFFTITALTREGNLEHKSIIDSDYYHRPIIKYEYVPADADNKDEEKQIRVGILQTGGIGWGNEPTGQKIQLVEYSEDKVHQILRDIPPVGAFTDVNNGCSLCLIKIGEVQDATTVKSLAEFMEPFDQIWQRHMDPNPGSQVDIKKLVSELQKQSATTVEQNGAYQ